MGVRHVEEFEILKGLRPKDDVTLFLRLAKLFGSNTRTVQECYAGVKYRYSEKARGPKTGPPRKLQPPKVEGTSESTTESTGASSVTPRHQDRRIKHVVRFTNNHNFWSFSGPPHIPEGEALKSC